LKDLEFAAHRNPDSRAALYNLARVYRALGRMAEAQTLFRQVRTQATDTLNEFGGRRLNEAMTDTVAQQ
jgi:tetratricopeptide (TPR) repeat protein